MTGSHAEPEEMFVRDMVLMANLTDLGT